MYDLDINKKKVQLVIIIQHVSIYNIIKRGSLTILAQSLPKYASYGRASPFKVPRIGPVTKKKKKNSITIK